MVFALILLPLFVIFVFTRDIALDVKKDPKLSLKISFLNFKIHLPKNNKKAQNKNKTKKNHPPYLMLIRKFSKRLRCIEITVRKINIPYKAQEFTTKSVLAPYNIYAVLNTVIALAKTKAKAIDIKDDAVCVSCDFTKLCLDITLRFKLFYIFPLLYDYLTVCVKRRKKKRRKAYVREQNG